MKDVIIALVRPVTVASEASGETMNLDVPYDSRDDKLQKLSATEALKRGIDVPPGWFKPEGESTPVSNYYKARVAENGCTFDADSGEYTTPRLESIAEQRAAEAVGFQQAISFGEQIPKEICSHANFTPAVSTAIEKVSLPIAQRMEPLPIQKITLPAAKVAAPHSPFPTITTEAKNEVTPIVHRFMREQQICMMDDKMLYAFAKDLGYYRKLSAQDIELRLMRDYGTEIMNTQNPAKILQDAAHLLRMMDTLRVNSGELNPFVWVFKDVIVNTLTGNTIPNDGSKIVLSALQCDYCPEATCPTFDQLIETISYGCADVKQLLWEVIAYILSPDTKAKKFFLFAGLKNSGKSLMANILTAMLGNDSCSCLNTSDLDKQFAIANLCGKRLNICMDLADEVLSQKAVGFIKMLTGGDAIHADRKFKDSIEFKNTAKLLLGSNFTLRLKTPDDAVNERMVFVPFRYSVPEEEQDHYLLEHIYSEFSGIALKAIPIYLDLKQRNLTFTEIHPSTSAMEGSQIMVVSDPKLEAVIHECFEFTANMDDLLSSGNAYDHYCQTCGRFGVRTVDHNSFSAALKKLCLGKDKKRINGTPENCFFGVKKK